MSLYFRSISLAAAARAGGTQLVWAGRVIGMGLSKFEPGRDVRDQSLATLVWLIEYWLLQRNEDED